jgi:hypothetical protein
MRPVHRLTKSPLDIFSILLACSSLAGRSSSPDFIALSAIAAQPHRGSERAGVFKSGVSRLSAGGGFVMIIRRRGHGRVC